MRSAVEPVAFLLLRRGARLDKYNLADEARCHHRTAQRVLRGAHQLKLVYVIGWRTVYKQYIPVYAIQPEGQRLKDWVKPKPMTSMIKARKRRKNPEVRMQEAYAKRMKRQGNGTKHQPTT